MKEICFRIIAFFFFNIALIATAKSNDNKHIINFEELRKNKDYSNFSNNYFVFQENTYGLGNCFGQSSVFFDKFKKKNCPVVSNLYFSYKDKTNKSDIVVSKNNYHKISFNNSIETTFLNKNYLEKKLELKDRKKVEFYFNINFITNNSKSINSNIDVLIQDNVIIFENKNQKVEFNFSENINSISSYENKLKKFIKFEEIDIENISNNKLFKLVFYNTDNINLTIGLINFIEKFNYKNNIDVLQNKKHTNYHHSDKKLTNWIEYNLNILKNNQDILSGGIPLGLPSIDNGSYWTVFVKEFCAYIYALQEYGYLKESRKAIDFLKEAQTKDGYWHNRYYLNGKIYSDDPDIWPGERDSNIFLPTIVISNQFKKTGDIGFLKENFNVIRNSLNYALKNYQKKNKFFISRINDNDPYNKYQTPKTQTWVYHFYNNLNAAIAFKKASILAKELGYNLLFLKYNSVSKKIINNIEWFYNYKNETFEHRKFKNLWKENYRNWQKYWKYTNTKVVDKKVFLYPGSLFRTKYTFKGTNKFKTLKFTGKKFYEGKKGNLGFFSHGDNRIYFKYDGTNVEANLRFKKFKISKKFLKPLKKINNFEINWNKESIKWRLNNEIIEFNEKKNIPKNFLPIYFSQKQNNSKNDYIEISNIKIIDSHKDKDFYEGLAARFTEPFLWYSDIKNNKNLSKKYKKMLKKILDDLKVENDLFKMGDGSNLESCSAQQSGQVLSALEELNFEINTEKIIYDIKKSSNSFGGMTEYSCPNNKIEGSSSISSWNIANVLIAYSKMYGFKANLDGFMIKNEKNYYSVSNYFYYGKKININRNYNAENNNFCINWYEINNEKFKPQNCLKNLYIKKEKLKKNNLNLLNIYYK